MVHTRVARVAGGDGMVGYALDPLRGACFGAQPGRLILFGYEALTRASGPTIKELYRLRGGSPYLHKSGDLAHEGDAFDAALGTPGLHEVRGRVE